VVYMELEKDFEQKRQVVEAVDSKVEETDDDLSHRSKSVQAEIVRLKPYLSILELRGDITTISLKDVKEKTREKIRATHPDKLPPETPGQARKACEDLFMLVKEASVNVSRFIEKRDEKGFVVSGKRRHQRSIADLDAHAAPPPAKKRAVDADRLLEPSGGGAVRAKKERPPRAVADGEWKAVEERILKVIDDFRLLVREVQKGTHKGHSERPKKLSEAEKHTLQDKLDALDDALLDKVFAYLELDGRDGETKLEITRLSAKRQRDLVAFIGQLEKKTELQQKIDSLEDIQLDRVLDFLGLQDGDGEDIELDLESLPAEKRRALFAFVDDELALVVAAGSPTAAEMSPAFPSIGMPSPADVGPSQQSTAASTAASSGSSQDSMLDEAGSVLLLA